MGALTEDLQDVQDQEQTEDIDFKMVTFSLAGKEYGIDIMSVAEISKADKFTYVPNSFPFVRGVYNLRGDIISIIDLRKMFNLPVPEKKEGVPENIVVLRLENNTIGVIVDSIDKVIGINSGRIQPPHPLFGGINIKYIKGVVENDGKLYIILDAERIFGEEAEEPPMAPVSEPEPVAVSGARGQEELDYSFVTETLATFMDFHVTEVNRDWVQGRFAEWRTLKGGGSEDIQLKEKSEAEEFLYPFYSSHTGEIWSEAYKEKFKALLPDVSGGTVSAWNAGCGQGYETYSLAVALKERYPDKRVKIWAHDRDLLSVANAPSMVFSKSSLDPSYHPFLTEGRNGYTFNEEIRDAITFEYHDILHPNAFPEVDVVIARDLLSFMDAQDQGKLLAEFASKLKDSGVLFVGSRERAIGPDWLATEKDGFTAYKKP